MSAWSAFRKSSVMQSVAMSLSPGTTANFGYRATAMACRIAAEAEVRLVVDHDEIGRVGLHRLEHLRRPVPAAVVHGDDLDRNVAGTMGGLLDRPDRLPDVLRLVVGGHEDRDHAPPPVTRLLTNEKSLATCNSRGRPVT